MKVIKYYCDCCGKELKTDGYNKTRVDVQFIVSSNVCKKEINVCPDCDKNIISKLRKIMENLNKINIEYLNKLLEE